MTIAIFKKITLFGLSRDKPDMLSRLQQLGCLHLKPLTLQKTSELTAVSTTLTDKIRKALLYLRYSKFQGPQKTHVRDFDADDVVEQILKNKKSLRDTTDRRDFLEERIRNIAEWGNFTLPKTEETGNNRLWFYKIKRRDLWRVSANIIVHEVHRNDRYVWLVSVSSDEPPVSAFPEPRIHTGAVALKKLQHELFELNEKMDDLNENRHHLTRFRLLLTREMTRFMNRAALKQANQCTHDLPFFFVLQGWLPVSRLSEMNTFCENNQIGMVTENPAKNESPPTLLETWPWAQSGMELVRFYQLPGYDTLDPSLMVFFSFAVFFAMILADAGYALIISLFTLLGWRWLAKSVTGKAFRPLLVAISIFSLTYGVMLGTYFGIEPHVGFLAQFRVLNINNFHAMMKVALAVGCLHIIAGNVMHAIFAKTLSQKIHASGFVFLISGSIFLAAGLTFHTNWITQLSFVTLAIGVVMVMAFADDLPVTSFKSFVLRLFSGLSALTHLPSLFGDILSYLRLFALGLAGASLALTFNHMAVQIATQGHGGYGWLLALPVLLFGQILNFALCLMSAVIHGLRLNYIEFFKWSVKKEGYAYSPLRKKQEISNE